MLSLQSSCQGSQAVKQSIASIVHICTCSNTDRLLKHDDASLQVHAEVHHDPINALGDVLLLLHHKHVVIEELLQLLVDKVYGDLLEAIVLKYLKASNVQNSTEIDLLHSCIYESVITLEDEVVEESAVDPPGDAAHRVGGLAHVLSLGHPLRADFDLGLGEGAHHEVLVRAVNDYSTII